MGMTTDIDCRKCFVKVVFCGRMGKRVGLRVFERKREGKVNRESYFLFVCANYFIYLTLKQALMYNQKF